MKANKIHVLCNLDTQRDAYLQGVLDLVLNSIQNSASFRDATFVLTGSMARGEASVIQTEEGYESLSDMEFLVTHAQPINLSSIFKRLGEFEVGANERVRKAGFRCKIEFTYAVQRFFETVRPSIFSYELKEHGKVIHGLSNPLSLMRDFSANNIPQIDAFYLLCNRILEQLDGIRRYFVDDNFRDVIKFRYSILKLYVDLATSILIFLGGYSSTYEGRRVAMLSMDWAKTNDVPNRKFLVDKVNHWTNVKLSPTYDTMQLMQHDAVIEEWVELARIALSIWLWELEQFMGRSGETLVQKCGKFGVLGETRVTLKAQVKYLLFALKRFELGVQAPFRFLYGNPRHNLYAESVIVYDFLASYFSLTRDSESNPNKVDLQANWRHIDGLVHVWTRYFRNA